MEQNQQPITPETPENKPGNGLSIAALVLGIVGIVFAFFLPYVGIVLTIVGIVLAVNAKKQGATGGLCTAGLVLSIIGTVFNGVMFACVLCVICALTPLL